MYYIDREALERKLTFLGWLTARASELSNVDGEWSELYGLAQERLLHLAMETVTDIGHMMIDCFMMRDAGSYEDIIEILRQEQVFGEPLGDLLMALVQLKSPLLKDVERRLAADLPDMRKISDMPNLIAAPHPLLRELGRILPDFVAAVRVFTDNEFHNIGG